MLEPAMQTSLPYRLGYPLQRLFVPFPLVCFTLAFATDLAFWLTVNLMWQNFSAWLLFAGLAAGVPALLAAMIDLFRRSTRPLRPALPEILGFLIILGLAFVNSLVHAGDGWTAVVPNGLILSAVTVLVIILTVAAAARTQRTWRV